MLAKIAMSTLQQIEDKFYSIYSSLNEETILHINKWDYGPLNNVLTGLENECFGVMCIEDTGCIKYRLFYINAEPELQGDIIELTIDTPDKDYLLLYFTQFLEHNYESLDAITCFNTFQQQVRTMLEKIGYLTVSSLELKKIEGQNPTLIAKGVKGIEVVALIDKISFYKGLFNNKDFENDPSNAENFIYLMLNNKSGFIKIGKSNNPVYRERTLHSQEPEIALITFWVAPKAIEKELHTQYSHKRKRGEWFKLSLTDLKKISEYMKSYE